MTPSTSAWWFTGLRLVGALALGLVLGWMLDAIWAGIVISLSLHLGWQLFNLWRLDRWLRLRSRIDPPDVGGVWGDVVAHVVRLHRRKRFHKQRLMQLFREIRRSTSAMPDGVVALNPQREIVWFNRTAGRMLGLQRKVDIGLQLAALVRHPEFARYLDRGEYEAPVVVPPHVPDGAYLSFQALPYGEQQLLVLVRDVTRQTHLEAMRRDFVANASHELRSPLTVIAGYLETLCQDSTIEPELQGPLAEMRRQAERMTGIVNDLLELSRLERSDRAPPGDPVDVAAMLAVLRKDVLARPVHPREVTVSIESDRRLMGVEAEIHSALANLVENAAKYTPSDGSIRMRWWVDELGGHVSIADTGIGIAPEHLPRITERFYRVDAGRARTTGGSGLGLAIVKHVLQRHGAQLEIQSEEGRGSTFSCHFGPERLAAPAREIAAVS